MSHYIISAFDNIRKGSTLLGNGNWELGIGVGSIEAEFPCIFKVIACQGAEKHPGRNLLGDGTEPIFLGLTGADV